MKKILTIIAALVLAGCAGAITKDSVTGTITVNVSASALAVATHDDLLGAAAVADKSSADAAKAGDTPLAMALTARANKWRAFDNLLTMQEGQASACANAIIASAPKASPNGLQAGAHVFTDIEIAAEFVGTTQGISPAVKLACADLPLPPLPLIKP